MEWTFVDVRVMFLLPILPASSRELGFNSAACSVSAPADQLQPFHCSYSQCVMPCIVHQRLLLRNQKQPNALESNGVISMLYLCLAVWLMNPGAVALYMLLHRVLHGDGVTGPIKVPVCVARTDRCSSFLSTSSRPIPACLRARTVRLI